MRVGGGQARTEAGEEREANDPLRKLREPSHRGLDPKPEGKGLRSLLARLHEDRLAIQRKGIGMNHITVRARNTDPETSHQAALDFEGNQSKASLSVACVVLILQARGPMTDFGLRDAWTQFWGSRAWSFTLPSKARHWAREQGLVKHAGFGTHQGRRVRLWALGRDDKFLEPAPRCECCGQTIKGRK